MALWSAVMAATGRDAASTAETLAGLFTVDVTGARAYSANPPPLYTGNVPSDCVPDTFYRPNPATNLCKSFRLFRKGITILSTFHFLPTYAQVMGFRVLFRASGGTSKQRR